jgi:RNA 2',3'-cyclic 3'-phosphodiesterase
MTNHFFQSGHPLNGNRSGRGVLPEQLGLPGFDAPAAPTDRLFFAIFPDPDACARVEPLAAALRARFALKGKPLATGRFHVTLFHLGDFLGVPPGVVARAREVASSVATPAFQIEFDRVLSFKGRPGHRPLVMTGGEGVAALTAFQQVLAASLLKAGLGGRMRQAFLPHLTLLYDGRKVDEHAIEPVAWRAHEFVLVRSLLGLSQYEWLGRWALV